MKSIIIISILLLSLTNFGQNQDCIDINAFQAISKFEISRKSDSISKILNSFWEEKARMSKLGIEIDNFDIQTIHFDQNCETTKDLDFLFHIIAVMQKDENISIEIVGNMDSKEEIENPLISKRRAEFVKKILLVNDIPTDRIIITDAKSNRPNAPHTKTGQEVNRRVDIYPIH